MPDQSWIAVDAMGGDKGVEVMMAGVARARRQYEGMRFLLVGDEAAIGKSLETHPNLSAHSEVVHVAGVVGSSDKPSQAIRRAKTTSMGVAIDLVKKGRAAAAVSSGNTGALMAMSKLALRMLPGIDRPALAAPLPTLGDNDVVMLDLGANTEVDAKNLVQFAVMGAVYARTIMDLERPRVALLNIGTEDMKGTEVIRDAAAALKAATDLPMSFEGFVEGDRLARGDHDVIVCDGFVGQIVVGLLGGIGDALVGAARDAWQQSLSWRMGLRLLEGAVVKFREVTDHRFYGGAPLLGFDRLAILALPTSEAPSLTNALKVAGKACRRDVVGALRSAAAPR